MSELEQGVPLKMLKMLSHLLQPLSSSDKILPIQDLSDYWERTECALNGFSDQFDAGDLQQVHLRNLGPIILGQAVWTLMKCLPFNDWDEFKATVEERFGLTES